MKSQIPKVQTRKELLFNPDPSAVLSEQQKRRMRMNPQRDYSTRRPRGSVIHPPERDERRTALELERRKAELGIL